MHKCVSKRRFFLCVLFAQFANATNFAVNCFNSLCCGSRFLSLSQCAIKKAYQYPYIHPPVWLWVLLNLKKPSHWGRKKERERKTEAHENHNEITNRMGKISFFENKIWSYSLATREINIPIICQMWNSRIRVAVNMCVHRHRRTWQRAPPHTHTFHKPVSTSEWKLTCHHPEYKFVN